jgi:hypothetical protein
MKFSRTIFQKSNVLALISFTYVISWLITAATLNIYVIYPSNFAILEGGIYFGALTPMQGTTIILFITAGGLATICVAWFVLLKIGNNVSKRLATYWEKQEIPIENAPTYNPVPITYPEEETYPLELEENISKAINYLKKHTLEVSVVSVLLSAFGTATIVFNGWDFQNAEPSRYGGSSSLVILGLLLLLIGIASFYGINAKYLNSDKLLSGTVITSISIAFLTSSIWLTFQRWGWNYADSSHLSGIHPLLKGLALPLFIISLISLPIWITLLKNNRHKTMLKGEENGEV